MVRKSVCDSRNQLRSYRHPSQHNTKSSCTEVETGMVTGQFTPLTHKSHVHKCPSAGLSVNAMLAASWLQAQEKLPWVAFSHLTGMIGSVGPLRTRSIQLLVAREPAAPQMDAGGRSSLQIWALTGGEKTRAQRRFGGSQDLARLIGESLSPYEASSERLGEAAVFTNAQIPAKNNEADKETGKCGPVIGSKYISGNWP